MDEDNIGYDSYSIDIRLKKHIPDVLPIRGKRVKLTYPGIPAFCNNCWRIGHTHWDCKRNKANWLEFVEDFFNNRDVSDDMLGSWVESVKKYLPSQGGVRKIKANQPPTTSKDRHPKVQSKVVIPYPKESNNEQSNTPPRLRKSSGATNQTQQKSQSNNQPGKKQQRKWQGRKKTGNDKQRGNN